jgi:hypothetical protein
LSDLSVEQSENNPGTDLEPNHLSGLRQRHSKRSPSRLRQRSQSRVRKQRPTRFLSLCAHCACGLLRHLSRTSEMVVLTRPSSQGAITSSHGSPWYRVACSSAAISIRSGVSNHHFSPEENRALASAQSDRDRGRDSPRQWTRSAPARSVERRFRRASTRCDSPFPRIHIAAGIP